jgi:hypothetical protein
MKLILLLTITLTYTFCLKNPDGKLVKVQAKFIEHNLNNKEITKFTLTSNPIYIEESPTTYNIPQIKLFLPAEITARTLIQEVMTAQFPPKPIIYSTTTLEEFTIPLDKIAFGYSTSSNKAFRTVLVNPTDEKGKDVGVDIREIEFTDFNFENDYYSIVFLNLIEEAKTQLEIQIIFSDEETLKLQFFNWGAYFLNLNASMRRKTYSGLMDGLETFRTRINNGKIKEERKATFILLFTSDDRGAKMCFNLKSQHLFFNLIKPRKHLKGINRDQGFYKTKMDAYYSTIIGLKKKEAIYRNNSNNILENNIYPKTLIVIVDDTDI